MRSRIINPSRFQLPDKQVFIEYDQPVNSLSFSKTQRRIRTFNDPYAARRFWIQMDREGRNPKIVKEESK